MTMSAKPIVLHDKMYIEQKAKEAEKQKAHKKLVADILKQNKK
jgi:hypothetical protein